MGDWTLTVAGREITRIFEVPHSITDKDKLGEIEVQVANTPDNRAIRAGESATLERGNETLFSGVVANKPTKTDDFDLPITITDQRQELQQSVVQRVFYREDSGDIVRQLVNKRAQPQDREFVFEGDKPDDWQTNGFANFEAGGFNTVSLNRVGNGVLYFDLEDGFEGTASLRRDSLVDIPPDRFYRLDVRSLVNNSGSVLDAVVEVTDSDANSYVWDLPLSAAEVNLNELPVQEATRGGAALTNPNKIEIRFSVDGRLPERRAGVLDFAQIYPFDVADRDTGVSPGAVETTGRTITRRFDGNVLKNINELAEEDGATVYVDESGTLHYEPSQNLGLADLEIVYGTDPIVEAKIDKPYDEVVNRVVVKGAGDISVVVENSESIAYYGAAAADERIVDESIQTEDEAEDRGRGALTPWVDVQATFTMGDSAYEKDLTIGQDIFVDYPPEDLVGEFEITEIGADRDGFPQVTVEGTENPN